MPLIDIALLAMGGLAAGGLAGLLGIGGGVLMVPLLLVFGLDVDQAAATSLLAILVTATTGSFQNWRMGHLQPKQVLLLAGPAIVLVLIGTEVGGLLVEHWRRAAFGGLLLANIYLVSLKKQIATTTAPASQLSPTAARLITGGTSGFMAGLFGVGGGVIMVPLQVLLMNSDLKNAVRNSLGVIVLTSLVACVYNSIRGDILYGAGLSLGLGGLVGVQISTRFLPKLPEQTIGLLFRLLLCFLATYVFWQAWQAWQAYGA
ncbi:sulfite exporter TauE/SafE family protein [Leptolyngbya cf. ectocarpi LEGE 11479]|uniref:Probable membrane transporter protein n=1 Tax=Leptolyngbya cf. ectocarpi LEGE 11479 TaxID=1828722 RepID=A0A928WX57_LEPEC|nr:sulfite exporter TauE/SafE family protein [Leptolyngbya ectocarpi]MBE9065100.1 sulfite exporter TauE/SafE family protein [Leptolyngbya cf. ectocarpi LEGE 11479]